VQAKKQSRTFLSADIVKSTQLIEDLGAEPARELLEGGLQIISEAVYQNGGSVIYTAGDGAVAEFQSLPVFDNHILLAISAGLDIQNNIKQKSLPYKVRIGIDTAQIKEEKVSRSDYAFAYFLQESASPGCVVLSEASYSDLKNKSQYKIQKIELRVNEQSFNLYQVNQLSTEIKRELQENLRGLQVATTPQQEDMGEIKLISIIFLSADETKEKVLKEDVERYVTRIKEILKDYDATLIKNRGLSAMAVVGAPIAHEDHATRACLIAQRILKISEKLSIPNKMRIGVHSGPAVLDDIGGEHFHQYDAIGSAVSFAARLEQLAEPGQAVISEETMQLVGDAIRVKELCQRELKGFKGIHVIYLLDSVARTYINQKLEWEFYSKQIFVDHVAEVKMFHKKLNHVSSQTVIWGIKAEPGVGKSRLSYEFSKIAAHRGLRLVTISALSYQKETPFSLLKQFFTDVFNIDPSFDAKKKKQVMIEALKRYTQLPPHGTSALLAVFGFPTENDWQQLPLKEQSHIITECTYQIIVFHINRKPTFFTMDDMHWCDSQSLSVFLNICARLKKEPLFILMCYRPEFHETYRLFQQSETALKPLSSHDSKDFMNGLLHGNGDLQAIKEKIIQQSDGNPFYMEEITRFLINHQILLKTGETYRLPSQKVSYEIPDTIQGVISGSIDQLSPVNKQLLQQASILGFVFSLSDLQMISELAFHELGVHLSELQNMDLVFTKTLFPETQYSFKHAYILDVTYQMMLTKNRVKYHEKFVCELEKQPDASQRLATLAYHSFQAKLWLKSFFYYLKSIPLQINIAFPISRILKDTDQAEQAYQQLSEEEQNRYFDDYAMIKLQQLHAVMANGRPDQVIGPFQVLEHQAIEKNNYWVQSLALAHLMVIHGLLNDYFPLPNAYQNILDLGTKALQEKKDIDSNNFIATLYFARALYDSIYADYDLLHTNSLQIRNRIPIPNTSSIWLGLPMWSVCRLLPMIALFEQMKLTKENTPLEEIIAAVTDQPPTESSVNNHWALGLAYFAWGDLDNSKKHFLLGLEESAQNDIIMFNPIFDSHLAFIAMLQGEHDKASQYAKKAYETSKMLGHMFFGISSMGRVATVLLHYGEFSLTKTLLDECLPLAEAAGQKSRCIEFYQIKADFLIASQEKPDAAEIIAILQKAEMLIARIGAIFFYPFVQRSYARLYKKLGDVETSNAHWQHISTFFNKHPANFWRDYFNAEF